MGILEDITTAIAQVREANSRLPIVVASPLVIEAFRAQDPWYPEDKLVVAVEAPPDKVYLIDPTLHGRVF